MIDLHALRRDNPLTEVAACVVALRPAGKEWVACCRGLRDGLPGWGQFCIDTQLAAALRGDVRKGLFFRGVGALPFGDQIRSVRELMQRLLTPNAAMAA